MFDSNGLTRKPHERNQRNEHMSDDDCQASIFYRDGQEDDIDDLSDLSVNFDNLILPETKAFGPLKSNDKKHHIETQKQQNADGIALNEKIAYGSSEHRENEVIVSEHLGAQDIYSNLLFERPLEFQSSRRRD